jgi:hypothetical protein
LKFRLSQDIYQVLAQQGFKVLVSGSQLGYSEPDF